MRSHTATGIFFLVYSYQSSGDRDSTELGAEEMGSIEFYYASLPAGRLLLVIKLQEAAHLRRWWTGGGVEYLGNILMRDDAP